MTHIAEHSDGYWSWWRRTLSATIAAVGVALGLSSASAVAAAQSALDGAAMQRAEAVLAQYSQKPKFFAPGPGFGSKRLDGGETLSSVPLNSQDPFVKIIEDDMRQVATKVGIHFVEYSNSGDPAAWRSAMEKAISQHANLIDLLGGINPQALSPQLLQAKSAHIPVVASDAYSVGQKSDPLLSGVMDVPYAKAGTIMADWTIVNSKSHAHALVIESNDAVSSPLEAGAAVTAFHQNCSSCTATVINVPVADWASQTRTKVASYLRAHPGTNYILPVYDSQSQYIEPAITAAGAEGKVHIVSYDGTAFVLDYLRKGQAVTMDVGEDLQWVAWAIMDQEMRIMAGLKPVPNEHTPMMIWTSQNIAQAGNPPQQSEGYGSGFITGYEKLWGLAS